MPLAYWAVQLPTSGIELNCFLIGIWNADTFPTPHSCKLKAGVSVLITTHLFNPWESRQISELFSPSWKPLQVHLGQLLILLERELMTKTQLMTASPVPYSSHLSHTFPFINNILHFLLYPEYCIESVSSPIWPLLMPCLLYKPRGFLILLAACVALINFIGKLLELTPLISWFPASPTLPVNTFLSKELNVYAW